MTPRSRQRSRLIFVLLAALAVLFSGAALDPAVAAPTPAPSPGDEGGDKLLSEVIEKTSREWVEAKKAKEESEKRYLELILELQQIEGTIDTLAPEVNHLAAMSYRTGRVGPVAMLLNSSSSDEFLQRAVRLDMMTARDNEKLRRLNEALDQAADAEAAITAELAERKKQLAIMNNQKKAAEQALRQSGPAGGFVAASLPTARPAPGYGKGSWPSESCSVDDPTTSGCLTPRTLHALKETQRAGFTKYVACYRPGDRWEHPKGRACDFSVQSNGFGGDATGDNKLYGNNLATFLVKNADRLGVLYVIWYRQVWLPSTGWKWYSGAGGDPSSDHTNHVHLSII